MNRSKILKYLRGETTEEERLEMLRWLEADAAHREEYGYLRKVFDATLCSEEDIPLIEAPRKVMPWYRWAGAAAVLLLCMLVGGGSFYYLFKPSEGLQAVMPRSIYVPVGQRVEITLDDETKVWLNSNSTLTVDYSAHSDKRLVQLDGEAYFEVSANKDFPFVVKTLHHEVQVLGTKFDVCAYRTSEDFSVRLYQGSVKVADVRNRESVLLTPNEEVHLSDGRLLKAAFGEEEGALWWKNGIYYFKNDTYEDIFKKVQEYYKVRIKVENPAVLQYRCTCKFRQEDGLNHILSGLQAIHRFEYEWEEDNESIVIR